ncbi:6897_t:CDS:2, partial [Acaulospora colombiana]
AASRPVAAAPILAGLTTPRCPKSKRFLRVSNMSTTLAIPDSPKMKMTTHVTAGGPSDDTEGQNEDGVGDGIPNHREGFLGRILTGLTTSSSPPRTRKVGVIIFIAIRIPPLPLKPHPPPIERIDRNITADAEIQQGVQEDGEERGEPDPKVLAGDPLIVKVTRDPTPIRRRREKVVDRNVIVGGLVMSRKPHDPKQDDIHPYKRNHHLPDPTGLWTRTPPEKDDEEGVDVRADELPFAAWWWMVYVSNVVAGDEEEYEYDGERGDEPGQGRELRRGEDGYGEIASHWPCRDKNTVENRRRERVRWGTGWCIDPLLGRALSSQTR